MQPRIFRSTPLKTSLELEEVRVLALGEAERRREVLREVLGLLDGLDDGLVNRLLVGGLRLGKRLLRLRLAILEELSLC